MDYKEIKKLMEDMGNSKLDSLEIEFPDGVKISMTKNTNKEVVIASPQNNNSNVIENIQKNINTLNTKIDQDIEMISSKEYL